MRSVLVPSILGIFFLNQYLIDVVGGEEEFSKISGALYKRCKSVMDQQGIPGTPEFTLIREDGKVDVLLKTGQSTHEKLYSFEEGLLIL